MADGPRYHPSDTDTGMGAHAAISATGLTRRYGRNTAVNGIDLRVRWGEIYGFLGPNGAGKSTVIRMLCTLLRPSAGTVFVAGHEVTRETQQVRIRIGVALQEAALDESQTGLEFLRLQGRLYGLSKAEVRQRLGEVLNLVDIGDAINRRIGTYSGGMKRRIDLAAALVHNPEILFLDEPTTGLDLDSRTAVWEEVRRLNHELGMTIFLTTQYLEEADMLADRVGIIAAGRLVAEGPPDDLKRSIGAHLILMDIEGHDAAALERLRQVPGVESVLIEEESVTVTTPDSAAALGPVVVALASSSLRLRALTLRTPTLDDVFKKLTGGHIDEDTRAA